MSTCDAFFLLFYFRAKATPLEAVDAWLMEGRNVTQCAIIVIKFYWKINVSQSIIGRFLKDGPFSVSLSFIFGFRRYNYNEKFSSQ